MSVMTYMMSLQAETIAQELSIINKMQGDLAAEAPPAYVCERPLRGIALRQVLRQGDKLNQISEYIENARGDVEAGQVSPSSSLLCSVQCAPSFTPSTVDSPSAGVAVNLSGYE